MSYEMTSITYDGAARQTNKFCAQPLASINADGDSKAQFYTGAPYLLSYELNIMANTHDDAYQILEQILPTFQPSYGVRMYPITGRTDITEDINFKLTSVSIQDDYEGAFTERQVLIITLTFDVPLVFHRGIADSAVIKEATVNYFDYDNTTNLIKGVTYSVNPSDATEDETYVIDTTEIFGYDDA